MDFGPLPVAQGGVGGPYELKLIRKRIMHVRVEQSTYMTSWLIV